MSKTSAIDLVMERVNKFVTCGCCDDDWPPLRRDIADTITRLQAALEEIRDRPGAGPEYHTGKGCIPRMISEAEKMAEIADRALRSSVGGE
jgi:hypothetical protein